ncbi:MAG: SIS domain-containing protein [Candidatus Sericytochromatia bacterium]|nr:SIS domain-containing protein [Candidatus Sericytochromatia bacterium]
MIEAAKQSVIEHFLASAALKQRTLETSLDSVLEAATLIADAFIRGHKLLICGNGGSAADCQHLAAEFVCRLDLRRVRRGLPALALTTDTSVLTAHANDESFDTVFARQVEALGSPGDVLLGISTSGRSVNVALALQEACRMKMRGVLLAGETLDRSMSADVFVVVPSSSTQLIQETFLSIEHSLVALVERIMFPNL